MQRERERLVESIFDGWQQRVTETKRAVMTQTKEITDLVENDEKIEKWKALQRRIIHQLKICWILLHRNFIKSYRDPLVYGRRLAMNASLSVVIGKFMFAPFASPATKQI